MKKETMKATQKNLTLFCVYLYSRLIKEYSYYPHPVLFPSEMVLKLTLSEYWKPIQDICNSSQDILYSEAKE